MAPPHHKGKASMGKSELPLRNTWIPLKGFIGVIWGVYRVICAYRVPLKGFHRGYMGGVYRSHMRI